MLCSMSGLVGEKGNEIRGATALAVRHSCACWKRDRLWVVHYDHLQAGSALESGKLSVTEKGETWATRDRREIGGAYHPF